MICLSAICGDLLLRSRPVDVELQNRRRVRILFLDLRRPGVARKLPDDGRDLVADVLNRGLDVAFQRERDVDRPWPWLEFARSSSMPLMVLTASSIRLVIWVSTSSALAPGQLDLHVDDRLIGLRHQVETEIPVGERAEHDERGRHHDREDRTLDADVCQFHCPAPSPRPRPPWSPRRPPRPSFASAPALPTLVPVAS